MLLSFGEEMRFGPLVLLLTHHLAWSSPRTLRTITITKPCCLSDQPRPDGHVCLDSSPKRISRSPLSVLTSAATDTPQALAAVPRRLLGQNPSRLFCNFSAIWRTTGSPSVGAQPRLHVTQLFEVLYEGCDGAIHVLVLPKQAECDSCARPCSCRIGTRSYARGPGWAPPPCPSSGRSGLNNSSGSAMSSPNRQHLPLRRLKQRLQTLQYAVDEKQHGFGKELHKSASLFRNGHIFHPVRPPSITSNICCL